MPLPDEGGSRRALSRAERRQRTRESVIEAAERSFRLHGFGDITMQRIAEEAGVSKTTVYACFGSKEGLLRALRERARDELLRRLGSAETADDEEPLLQLEKAFDGCCDIIRQRHSLGLPAVDAKALASAGDGGSPEGTALKRLAAILRLGMQKGVFRALDPDLAAFFLFKAFEACVLFLQNPECPLGLEEVEDGLFDFIRRGIMV